MDKITIRRPDNWHAHLRQKEMLFKVAHYFDIYGRVLCMGNTSPPIETANDAFWYQKNILYHKVLFEPVMCIMLTQNTTAKMIYQAAKEGIKFIKFIPVGTSFGSRKGLRIDDFKSLYPIFSAIQETGLHLLLHSELESYKNGKAIHLLQREEASIKILSKFCQNFPCMKITVEHASTAKMITFVKSHDSVILRATLTPHHALLNYNDYLRSPLYFCLPVAKLKEDIAAVKEAMMSGDSHFFFGADSAPHFRKAKNGANPSPGIFFGPAEFPLLVQIFDQEKALDKLENFTSVFGAQYYGYLLSKEIITLVKKNWQLPVSSKSMYFCFGGKTIEWKIKQ